MICIGGQYNRELGAFVGPQAERALSTFYADISFLAAAHVNIEQGLVNDHLHETTIKRTIHDHAGKCYLLADSTKFGVRGLQSTLTMDEFRGSIITDHGLPEDQATAFRDRGAHVLIA